MSGVPSETRAAAYQVALPLAANTREVICEALRAHPQAGLTADELHQEVNCGRTAEISRNDIRSRLTELAKGQRVGAVGKRLNAKGTVRITVWALRARA